MDFDKNIENLKIKIESLEQKEKKVRNIFMWISLLLTTIFFYTFYFYYSKKIVLYILEKNEIKDEVIIWASLLFNGLLLMIEVSAFLLFYIILNYCFEKIYLKKLNDKINILYNKIELENEREKENN